MAYISGKMPKSDKTKRVEIHLLPEIIEDLKKLSVAANRSLKNYIETILIDQVNNSKKKKS